MREKQNGNNVNSVFRQFQRANKPCFDKATLSNHKVNTKFQKLKDAICLTSH